MLRTNRIRVLYAEIRRIDESRTSLLEEREEYLKRIRRNEKAVRSMVARALVPESRRRA